jgi:alkylated DNA repair dioxygenase AlkB
MIPQAQGPAGLRLVPEFVSPAVEQELLARLAALAFRPVEMHGRIARRTALHYGWDYHYDSWRITPAEPVPAFLSTLRARAAALIDVAPEALEEVLVTRYPPGAGIGWHRDAPMFGPAVVGVSLGAEGGLRFRRRGEARTSFRLCLPRRSAYVLAGEARARWQHTLSPQREERVSVTFRTLAAHVRPPS